MAGIDIVYYAAVGISTSVAWGSIGSPGIWLFLVLISDVTLLVSTIYDKTGPMLVWQIVMMVHIVLQFIMWIGAVLIYVFLYAATTTASNVVTQAASQFNATAPKVGFDMVAESYSALLVVLFIQVFVMPIYDVYFWVVVKSHKTKRMENERQIYPTYPPGGEHAVNMNQVDPR